MKLTTIKIDELPHPSLIIATGAQRPLATLSDKCSLMYVVPKGNAAELARTIADHARETYNVVEKRSIYWTVCSTEEETLALVKTVGMMNAILELKGDGEVVQHKNRAPDAMLESWRYEFEVRLSGDA